MPSERPHYRKVPVHGVFRTGSGPTIVFVTACAKDKTPWMAAEAVHAAMRNAWLTARDWLVGRYVIMPTHVHLFASPGEGSATLETWMRYWKYLVSRVLGTGAGKWQQGHWDTRMRTQAKYAEKWDYVRMNPVRQGLVQHPEDWPYAGEVHPLMW